jgi:hypothetical protein
MITGVNQRDNFPASMQPGHSYNGFWDWEWLLFWVLGLILDFIVRFCIKIWVVAAWQNRMSDDILFQKDGFVKQFNII